jgi:hypothetical protein
MALRAITGDIWNDSHTAYAFIYVCKEYDLQHVLRLMALSAPLRQIISLI